MEAGSRDAPQGSSSGQLEDWAARVEADLKEERVEKDEDKADLARQRSGSYQPSAVTKRTRQPQERESSPDDENGGDEARPKLPRPDKKEPCPRCSSMDTKFCYYNNYNIKQPRFYCKACQRYWTAGGTLRNIAPGSGRRKSKSKAPGREQRDSPSLADHLTAAAAVAQTGMFGLPVGASAAYGNLNTAHLLAAADPTGLLTGGAVASAAYAHHQLLASHSSLAGLKLSGAAQLQSQWASGTGMSQDMNGSSLEQLQGHMGSGASGLAHIASGQQGLDARALLNGHHHNHEDLQAHGLSWRQLAAAHANAMQQGNGLAQRDGSGLAQRDDVAHAPSRSASPPAGQQRQLSSPQQHNSQLSQQPSPSPAQRNGYGSEDLDGDDIEVYYGRPVRLKPDVDSALAPNGNALGSGAPLGLVSSLNSAQLAGLSMPPSMASLAAVMGPPGGNTSMHQFLSQECGAGGLLDGANNGLSRLQLQLALQQQVAQQENLSQLQGLLQNSAVTAALQAQHPFLQGFGHQNGSSVASHNSAAAAVSALDPLQRSVGGVGNWLQGGGGMSGMLPSSVLQAAAGGSNCGSGGWSGAAGPSWSLWSSYQNSTSNGYAGYALQAAAAAAYSSGR